MGKYIVSIWDYYNEEQVVEVLVNDVICIITNTLEPKYKYIRDVRNHVIK